MESDLPRFIRDVISSPPAAGTGVHTWLFRCACLLHHARTEAEIIDFLKAQTFNCGRVVPDREIIQAVKLSKAKAWRPGETNESQRTHEAAWPKPDFELIHATVLQGPGLVDLWEASPVRLDIPDPSSNQASDADPDWSIGAEQYETYTEDLIDQLFPGNPLLCVAHRTGMGDFATRRRETWRAHLQRCALLVPSPMIKVLGETQISMLSEHSLQSTDQRKYLVIEFDISRLARDHKTPTAWAPYVHAWEREGISIADACAALAFHLAGYAPLVLVLSSALFHLYPKRG